MYHLFCLLGHLFTSLNLPQICFCGSHWCSRAIVLPNLNDLKQTTYSDGKPGDMIIYLFFKCIFIFLDSRVP
jgi:hypothetical protein